MQLCKSLIKHCFLQHANHMQIWVNAGLSVCKSTCRSWNNRAKRHAMNANRHAMHANLHAMYADQARDACKSAREARKSARESYIQPFVLCLVASGLQWTVSNLTLSLAFRIGGTRDQASLSLPSKFGCICMVTPLKRYYDLSTELSPIGPTLSAPSLKLGNVWVLRQRKRHCVEART